MVRSKLGSLCRSVCISLFRFERSLTLLILRRQGLGLDEMWSAELAA
jgi:hypothetical protein